MSRIITVALLGLLTIPSAARANEFIEASYELTRDNIELVLSSSSPTSPPRVHIERGAIRLSFSGITDQQWLAPSVDGRVIRSAEIYSGAGDRAIVRVTFGDKRLLDRDAIQIRRHGTDTTIRISRDALPDTSELPARKLASSEVNEAKAPPRESAKEQPAQPPTELAAAPRAPEAVPPPPASILTPPANSPSPGTSLLKASPSALAESHAQFGVASGSNTLVIMVVTSILLLGVYGAIRLGFGKRPAPTALPNIQVIGSKRLGPRHQLVLVRALGEDHLLSINAGHTERIASSSAPATVTADTSAEPFPRTTVTGLFPSWQTSTAALLEKAERLETEQPDQHRITRGTPAARRSDELLHFGDRKGKSPLELFNGLEARRLRDADADMAGPRLRERRAS